MSWLQGSQALLGVGAVALSVLLLWLVTDRGDRPIVQPSATRLIVLPMTIMLIFIFGVALLFMSAGLI